MSEMLHIADEAVEVSRRDIPIPPRLNRRPRDKRGFIVPYFVAWLEDGELAAEPDGEPDFRVVDHNRMAICVRHKICWLCGQKLGVHMAFVLGPMCTINKIISEPPSHKDCAEYALRVCPFLANPRMRRNEKDLPEGMVEAAGIPAGRNPGTMALWVTRSYTPLKIDKGLGNEGVLFQVGPFTEVSWWKEGRRANRVEAVAAIDDGYKLLMESAKQDGADAVEALERMTVEAMRTLPI